MDAARFILGEDPVTQVVGLSPPSASLGAGYRATTLATVQFASGIVGKISGSTEFFMPYVFNVEVFGDEGVIRNNRFYSKRISGQRDFAEIPTVLPDSGAVSHHPFQEMIDHFVSCILDDVEPEHNLAGAVNTHLACLAAEASAAQGGRPLEVAREIVGTGEIAAREIGTRASVVGKISTPEAGTQDTGAREEGTREEGTR